MKNNKKNKKYRNEAKSFKWVHKFDGIKISKIFITITYSLV